MTDTIPTAPADPFNPARYVPADSRMMTGAGVGGVAYVREGEGRFYAMGYAGKSAKAAFNYSFHKRENRDQYVTEFFSRLAARELRRRVAKTQRDAFEHTLKVGDILVCSWGYEQTNIDWYEVVRVPSTKSAVIREIANATKEETGFMTGSCTPAPGKYVGEEMTKRVGHGNSVRIASYSHASPWDGKPERWSSYA